MIGEWKMTDRPSKKEKSKAVLVFGTVNPITNAHLELGKVSASLIKDADIYYIPSSDKYIKGWKKLPEDSVFCEEDRLSLLKSVVEPYGFMVSDIEIRGLVSGRTFDTVEYFKSAYGYQETYVVVGSDKVLEMSRWKKIDKLTEGSKFLVFRRNGIGLEDIDFPFGRKVKSNFIQVNNADGFQDISSTKVREYYKNGDLSSVKEFIPQSVYNYLLAKINEESK